MFLLSVILKISPDIAFKYKKSGAVLYEEDICFLTF